MLACSGPFQRKEVPELLEVALDLSISYVDVCDDIALATKAKALHGLAVEKGVPALISTGVWPGISSLSEPACTEPSCMS